jgi:hypothetical protein
MDLAALTLERAQRQQQHYSVPHQEEQGDPATTNTISPTPTLTSDGTAAATTHDKKRKRKRVKAQQQLQSQLAIPTSSANGDAASLSLATFDETLLAVIGILHAARLQSSIAGWLRAGALSLPSSSAERDGGGPGDGRTWYDDPVLVRAWASRGREAMRELGLKVEHGVEA